MGILNTRWCIKSNPDGAGAGPGNRSAFLPFCCTPYSAVPTGSVSLARPRAAPRSDWLPVLYALRGAPGATSYIPHTDRWWKNQGWDKQPTVVIQLQWGHHLSVVETMSGGNNNITDVVNLQWGHRLSVVETAYPPRIQTRSSRFNGAIAFRQWIHPVDAGYTGVDGVKLRYLSTVILWDLNTCRMPIAASLAWSIRSP